MLDRYFLLADDLGYMDIGANNPQTFYEAPNTDRIAAQGMRFTACDAAGPVCLPTRAGIATGMYPPRTGINDFIGGERTGRRMPDRDFAKVQNFCAICA